jgi:methylmalonyl-CoA/ethylmalonyl-CoA epimerase
VTEPAAELPVLPDGYEFHHVGYATASIENEKDLFAFLGYEQEGECFSDETQGVTGCFLTGPGPRVELLQNLPGSETLTPWLDAGVKMYHFAYFVDSLDDALSWVSTQRARVVVAPVPAVAFNGSRISFVMFRNGLLLEFIEKGNG